MNWNIATPVSHRSNAPSRRDFLRVGAAGVGAAGLALTSASPAMAVPTIGADCNCIVLFLLGGPSQLDTWDPKPQAPSSMRGPFRTIRSAVPGIHLAEPFPLMAASAHRFALVRSVHHHEAPVHETGHQLMQTGRLAQPGLEFPHPGSVVSQARGATQAGVAPFVVLPGPIGNTGINISHGQGPGFLGDAHAPRFVTPDSVCAATGEPTQVRDLYGDNDFGRSCLSARRLIESGSRVVTVNMFQTLFNQITWDCHADGGALGTTLADYRDTVCPMFDRAFTGLLQDLDQRGMLDTTLVVAMGEFGRTPRLNRRGGRDHWPGVWSIVMAGGPIRGGQVVGASDRFGAEPSERPVTPAEVTATIYHALGFSAGVCLKSADDRLLPLMGAAPVCELF